MSVRSLLFVPGDRSDRFPKAMNSAADALILDLEDSVSLAKKPEARKYVSSFLQETRAKPVFVRINPLSSGLALSDLEAVLSQHPDGIVLPKSESAADIDVLLSLMGSNPVPILPIATETPKSMFGLGTYVEKRQFLFGLTWGAEDLPAATGAISSREEDGSYTPIYQWVRAQALLAAHAAETLAIETVYPNLKDMDGLKAYADRGRRDGFSAMMALHPAQCEHINASFTPTEDEVQKAKRIIEAFAQQPDAGVLSIDGQMVDQPHLIQARKTLERAQASAEASS